MECHHIQLFHWYLSFLRNKMHKNNTELNMCLVSGLSLMVMQFLRRYNENPTNMYILTFDEPIFKAPFPAVTICPTMPIPMQKRLAILENAILPENVSREFALNILKYVYKLQKILLKKKIPMK